MHNLAIALHINHHTVSGSDDEIYNPARDRLAAKGLLPQAMGWHPFGRSLGDSRNPGVFSVGAHPLVRFHGGPWIRFA